MPTVEDYKKLFGEIIIPSITGNPDKDLEVLPQTIQEGEKTYQRLFAENRFDESRVISEILGVYKRLFSLLQDLRSIALEGEGGKGEVKDAES
jgi:hypothetical protein